MKEQVVCLLLLVFLQFAFCYFDGPIEIVAMRSARYKLLSHIAIEKVKERRQIDLLNHTIHHIKVQKMLFRLPNGNILQAPYQYGQSNNFHFGHKIFIHMQLEIQSLENKLLTEEHRIILIEDKDLHFSMISHFFRQLENNTTNSTNNTNNNSQANSTEDSGELLIDTADHDLAERQSSPQSSTQPSQKRTLKIMTFNIWNFNKWPEREDAIGRVLRRQEADIVAMQEVRYEFSRHKADDHRFQAIQLLNQLDEVSEKENKLVQYHWEAAMIELKHEATGYNHVDEGLAAFSKFDVLEYDYVRLSRNLYDSQDGHYRICQRFLMDMGSPSGQHSRKYVELYNTHLSLSEAARKRSAVELMNFADKNYRADKVQVLVGDFNEEPSSFLLHYLTSKGKPQKGNFTDSWRLCHPEENGFTFPNDKPIKRIDFILFRGEVEVLNCEVDVQGSDASDHLSYTVTFSL